MEDTEADTRLGEMSGWCKVGPGAVAVATVCNAFKLADCNSEEPIKVSKPIRL
jgi:hypothetical protein